ncbi:potassium channel family protein [Legionella anisa]|nr:potassium channel family protein [Legionella anisa]KTC74335.1 Ion channel [Legionella anisa]MBN5937394.1 hypothetical protein [Legionella anisa]MCW8425239.1 ion channel [Legionella anisa]MCW8449331.1 ion channel [Legionella anisa]UAK79795.1 hypothetical protein K8O89_01505 [Legionella anisa]
MLFRMIVEKKHRYEALLLSLIGFIFATPMLPGGRIGDVLFGGLFLLVIFLVSFSLTTHLTARWSLFFLGILSLIFGALVHYGVIFAILSRVTMFLFFCTAIGVLGHDIFNKTSPRVDHLYGAIIIYFLIGITYALAYQFFQLINPQELIISGTGLPVTKPFDLYYFSFITLGTVGYGDIIAHGQFAKIISMLESMTGLFYLAIMVASLVGVFQSEKK